jgi:hypothetical protein
MKNIIKLAMVLSAVTFAGCGDDEKATPDAPKSIDAPADVAIDALTFPAAPTLGTQVDRMGRPAVNTALNAVLDTDPLKTAKKDRYNAASNPATWKTTQLDPAMTAPMGTVLYEFMKYLAVFDTLDQGSGLPNTTTGAGGGCGNGALFNMPANTGYGALATVLANDELYVDTAKTSCNLYLSVEVDVIAGTHSQCGGRTPTHDVIDMSYSLLAAGTNGFNQSFAPLVGDGVGPHTDVNNDVFPFLGAPHMP